MLMLIFGPDDTYFFEDGQGNRKWRAWPAFDKYMTSRPIGEINNVAFGEGETFFINYAEGLRQHRNYMEDPHDRYAPFLSWAFNENIPHDRSSVTVNFGMDGAFFAKSSQGHRWQKVPEKLVDFYQKFTRVDLFLKQRINTVDLGFNGTFLGIQVDNTWFWELGEEYTELSRLIGQKSVNSCRWISISPFKAQQHFVAFEDGTIHWALPAHWIQDMQSIIKLYAVQRGAHVPQSPPPQTVDPFAHFAAQMNQTLPTYSMPNTAYPPKMGTTPPPSYWSHSPGPQPPSQSTSPPLPSKNKWWRRTSSSQQPPQQQQEQQQIPVSPPYSHPPQPVYSPGGSSVDWNQMMNTAQNSLDAYNNTFGTQAQQQSSPSFPSADTIANGVDTLNNGVQLVNNLTGTGSMMGQLVVQGAGAAAACCVM